MTRPLDTAAEAQWYRRQGHHTPGGRGAAAPAAGPPRPHLFVLYALLAHWRIVAEAQHGLPCVLLLLAALRRLLLGRVSARAFCRRRLCAQRRQARLALRIHRRP